MKLSAKRKQELYDAIHEAVRQARIEIVRRYPGLDSGIDYRVSQIGIDAFRRALTALGAKDNCND